MSLLQRVSHQIARLRLLAPGQAVLAAVSGGPDSLCLLHLLLELDYPVQAAHLDHGLRPSSQDEAGTVGRLMEAWGVPLASARVDVAEVAAGSRMALEEAGRTARYQFLVRVATEQGLYRIATGHTLDDQAETIVMHFLRGSGPDGLRGMQPTVGLDEWVMVEAPADLKLIRPLLVVERQETQAYCRRLGIEPIEDRSNLDPAFTRNRIRHQLIPILASYNPAVKQMLARTGEVMRAVASNLEDQVSAAWPAVVRPAGDGALAIQRSVFLGQPVAVQRRLLRQAVADLRRSLRDLGFEHVERARGFIEAPEAGQTDLVAGLMLEAAGDEVVLRGWETDASFPEVPQIGAAVQLPAEGTLALPSGWQVRVERQPAGPEGWPLADRQPEAAWVERFDAEQIVGPMSLRQRQPGDRIEPLGFDGSQKLSDLFIDSKVPAPQRDGWPIVVDGQGILWVVGLRRSERAKLTPGTSSVIRLLVDKSPQG